MKDLNLEVKTIEVTSKVKVIRCEWTREIAKGLYYFGNTNLFRKNKIK